MDKNDTVFDYVKHLAKLSSAQYIEEHMSNAVLISDPLSQRFHTLSKIQDDGLIAEFGVWKGESINFFADCLKPRTVYGFDSFEGLPEDWRGDIDRLKARFDRKGKLPLVHDNVVLIKGWFEQTVPEWVNKLPLNSKFSFIHFDSDLYSSTKTVLDNIYTLIKSGTVITFDEYIGRPGWKNNEYKAWQEFVQANNVKYEYINCGLERVTVQVI